MNRLLFATLLCLVTTIPVSAQNGLPQGTVESEFRRNAQWILDRTYNVPNQYFLYLDTADLAVTLVTDRVRRTSKGVEVWTNWYYKDAQNGRYGTYTYDKVIERQLINCTTRRWTVLRSIAYDGERVVNDYQNPYSSPSLEETIPNSIGEAVVDRTCEYLRRHR